jgi:predicted nuclease of predicted toxin-antitoxin system
MKIKLDENMPSSLVAALSALGHDVDTAPAEGLAGHSDPNVWRATQAAERFLITQDQHRAEHHARQWPELVNGLSRFRG